MKITTTDFLRYLELLGLFRFKLDETTHSFEATVVSTTKPNIGDFTQMYLKEDGTYYVRLSKKDLDNTEITKGFFNINEYERLKEKFGNS